MSSIGRSLPSGLSASAGRTIGSTTARGSSLPAGAFRRAHGTTTTAATPSASSAAPPYWSVRRRPAARCSATTRSARTCEGVPAMARGDDGAVGSWIILLIW